MSSHRVDSQFLEFDWRSINMYVELPRVEASNLKYVDLKLLIYTREFSEQMYSRVPLMELQTQTLDKR